MSIYIVSMDTSINIIPLINSANKKIRGQLVIATAMAFSSHNSLFVELLKM